jgi:signal transduction histidine kinase
VQPIEALIQLADMEQDLTHTLRQIRANSTGPYRQVAADSLPTGFTQDLSAAIDATISRSDSLSQGSDGSDSPSSQLLDVVKGRDADAYSRFRTGVADAVEAEANRLVDQAERTQRLYLAAASLVILLTILIGRRVALSITRPLKALTKQAAEMANGRLPDAVQDILETPLGEDVTVPHMDPIAVQTRDEVADVADALNTVQDSALELAVEQAVLRRNIADSFVNLGRRNQNLLGRQLDFITELEQNETDPETLANLFRLDHLATRMRRNAESLLVLAGIEPPRKWAAPVRVTDVIRAALGEVEDYQRATVRTVEPATIVGSAAADLAHLLAELTENALIFSPPDRSVEIRGRTQNAAESGQAGYMFTVADSGAGMRPEEITRANRRLAGAESFTIAPSKYLGHYVVGKLAAFHGLDVRLHSTPGGGITATVHLTPDLVAQDGDGHQPVSPVGVLNTAGHAPNGAVASTGGARPASLPIHG